MALTLRASLLGLLLAGSLVPLAGLAAFEYGTVSAEREARETADLQSAALAAALRAEDAVARGTDPYAAASASAPGEVRFVGPRSPEWAEFEKLAGERVSGVERTTHPTEGHEVLVAWGRAPALGADVVILREPNGAPLQLLVPFLLLASFLAGGVIILLAFVGSRILAPVAHLERASQRLARGDWHERVETDGPAEVRSLASSFNAMAAALHAQRQQLDQLLDERTRDLIDRESDLDALRFTLAHEFREPLRSLRWTADDLLERPLHGDAREAARLLRRRIDDIDAVFRDLLRYEDISRRPAPMEQVSLERILGSAIDLAAEDGPIEVNGPPLPIIEGNGDLLHVALVEILRNAARYAGTPARPAYVTLHVEEGEGDVVIHFDDRGPGIPPARREDAIQLFQRLRRDLPGTGAGLAIARRAVERHGGTITLHEAPGGGARVTLRLPRSPDPTRAPRPATTQRRF